MKNLAPFKTLIQLISFSAVIFFSACNKEKLTSPAHVQKSYTSIGNFLILQVSENFVGAVEYNLQSIATINDSIPIVADTFSTGIEYQKYWKFEPNIDTIFSLVNGTLAFNNSLIPNYKFYAVYPPIDFSTIVVQNFSPGNNTKPEEIWNKIADLDIVATYRTANPNAKVGFLRVVSYEYNEALDISLPIEKHLVFLTK